MKLGAAHAEILEQLGLTKSEIAVYAALFRLGSSTTGPIVKEAGISSGKIYEILGKLAEKGLVSYIIKSSRKYFQPTDPRKLLDYLEGKQRILQETKEKVTLLARHFEAEMQNHAGLQQAEIFEGVEGFKTFSEFCLKTLTPHTDYCILGVSKAVNERFGTYLLNWQKRRAAKKVSLRIIYNADAYEHGRKRERLPHTQVRYLPSQLETPALIEIFNDYVATVIVTPKPIIFMIRSKAAAESYLKYFNLMWKLARYKPKLLNKL